MGAPRLLPIPYTTLFRSDRKKDLIKTAGGKYVAPQPIENTVKLNKFVANAVVLGDQHDGVGHELIQLDGVLDRLRRDVLAPGSLDQILLPVRSEERRVGNG